MKFRDKKQVKLFVPFPNTETSQQSKAQPLEILCL